MKKIVSILICISMLISVVGISAFAAEDKPFYLVLGDSIAYGSGLGNPREACYGQVVADTNGVMTMLTTQSRVTQHQIS